MSGMTLKCSNVNSGNGVWLVGATCKIVWKNLIKADPIPGKYDTVEIDKGGWENPTYHIEGVIDADSTGGTTTVNNESTCSEVTQSLLQNFAKETANAIWLKIGVGASATPVYISGANTTSNAIKVVVDNFNIDIDPESELGHLLNYTLDLVETQ